MSSVLEWATRRNLTNQNNYESVEWSNGAAELLKADYLSDAANFMIKSGDKEGLKQIAEEAVKEGNFFIFNQAVSALEPEYQTESLLISLIKNAEQKGLNAYAEQAKARLQTVIGA